MKCFGYVLIVLLLVSILFFFNKLSQKSDACEYFLKKTFYEKIYADGSQCNDYNWVSDRCIDLYDLAYASCGENPHTIMQKRGYNY